MFRNITYLKKPSFWKSFWKSRKPHPFKQTLEESYERDWLHNRALKFFDANQIELVLTARRPVETPELIQKSFDKFEVPKHFIVRDEHFANGLKWTKDNGKPNRMLHPVCFPDLRYYPWNLPPNAEAPWNIDGYRFKPAFRDIDGESENPKLQEKVNQSLIYQIRDSISVKDYLEIKHSIGLNADSKPTFHNLYNEIFIRNRQLIHEIKEKDSKFWNEDGTPKPYFWNTVHIKTTVVEEQDDDKIRIVFGSPKLINQAENMFLWPLQATYLNTGTGFMMWGREIIRGGWRRINRELSEFGYEHGILCIDWSSWDKNFSFELQDEINTIFRSYFDFTLYEPTSKHPLGKPDPSKIEALWQWTNHATKHTPSLLPSGELAIWNYSGFGSGYQCTQIKDSFGNAIVTSTCASSMGIQIFAEDYYAKFQGDDAYVRFLQWLMKVYGPTFLAIFASAAKFYFGHVLNTKKSASLQTIENSSFLSYECKHGLPFRTVEDLLRHLFFPRSPRRKEELAGSALGLAYANSGIHLRYHQLCEYIWTKLVIEQQVEPIIPRDMQQMLKYQIGTEEPFSHLNHKTFPTFSELTANVYTYTPRSEHDNQKLWPTKPGPAGNFFFLKPV